MLIFTWLYSGEFSSNIIFHARVIKRVFDISELECICKVSNGNVFKTQTNPQTNKVKVCQVDFKEGLIFVHLFTFLSQLPFHSIPSKEGIMSIWA
jgi:hypothetical protein